VSGMTAIEFHGVSKSFVRHRGHLLLRERLTAWIEHRKRDPFFALKNVSFSLAAGDGLAVIGSNGAGKSTLMGLAAGLATPDAGTVRVRGRVATLLELGSGFHFDLTGRENIEVNAALIGLSRRRTSELFDRMVEFSGIGDFLDEPLRTYSSGMILRLAFSVAINTDPDILLIDEILAVGDHAFQVKCFEQIHRLRHAGKTLLCVSHAPAMLQELCNRAIWLEHGELRLSGALHEVVDAYQGQRASACIAS